MNVTVLGAGAWGTALALVLDQGGHQLTLWGHDPAHLRLMRDSGRNEAYLPGLELPRGWSFVPDLKEATRGAEMIVVVVPSKAFRTVISSLGEHSIPMVSATKGIEYDTGLTMAGVLKELHPKNQIAALSGPSLAPEVARGVPTAMVAAAEDPATAEWVQTAFHRPSFRVYRSTDRLGVELGGALKNVIAIAAGVCDGLKLGDNAKAALITRGQAEVRRLGVACGAEAATFAGLSGLGDLMLTCYSRLSRNRTLGEKLGAGISLEEATATATIAEGVPTTRSALRLAESLNVDVPIIREVHAMLFEGKQVMEGVRDLLARELKQED